MAKDEFVKKIKLSEKQKFTIAAVIVLLFLGEITFSFCSHINSVNEFNRLDRVVTHEVEGKDMRLTIYPRGGTTDAWLKDFYGYRDFQKVNALIYEGSVYNNSIFEIADWQMRVDIPKDMFLSNGWCGTFEIHQNVNSSEIVQTVSLQDYDKNNLSLEHFFIDQDLMIPLKEGDYFIYYPDRRVKESPIAAIDPDIEEYKCIHIGFICYYSGSKPVFDKSTLSYHFNKKYFDGEEAVKYVIMGILWAVVFVVFVTSLIYRSLMQRRLRRSNLLINSAMTVFTNFFEAKDSYTRGHSRRVAEYSKILARECGISDDDLQTVFHIAYMHDCGKCYIPDKILKKEARLDDYEFEVIKGHTVKGAEMVAEFTAIKGLQDGVRHHHERYDGHGYPDGLKGKDIPWIARVICIADSYDAMSSDRCYRKKLDRDRILEEFERGKGTQFDPELADIFVGLIKSKKI